MKANVLRAGLLLFALATTLHADDWLQWRGPNRDGISKEKGWSTTWPAEGPKQLWKASLGTGYSSMSVSKGKLFTMGNTEENDSVYCLDANTGKELWKHTYPCSAKDPNGYPGTRCTPTVDGDRVYTVSRRGHLFCINVADGKVVWSKNYVDDYQAKVPTWGFSTSPLIEKNMLIVETGATNASVIAFDKKTGKEIWKSGDDGVAYSSPVAFTWKGQREVALLQVPGLVARSMKDGKELWRHPWKTMYDVNAATPIVQEDKAFISSGYNTGCALVQFSENPPKVVWQSKAMRNHVNSCVLWQNHLYGFDGNAGKGTLKCLDWNTGEERWTHEGLGTGSLMIADEKLILFSDDGRLLIAKASPEKYEELASAKILEGKNTWAAPVLANGKIYCRHLENLVCVDVSGK